MERKSIHSLLFLGTCLPRQVCYDNQYCASAANNFQVGLIEELLKSIERISLISLYPMASFPEGQLLFHSRRLQLSSGPVVELVPFLNVLPFKPFVQAVGFLWYLLRHMCVLEQKPDVILTYNLNFPYGAPALIIGRLWDIPVVAITADLAGSDPRYSKSLKHIVNGCLQSSLAPGFDGLITLSRQFSREFGAGKPVLELDGGVDQSWFRSVAAAPDRNPSADKKAVMFGGRLGPHTGVTLLLESFNLLQGSEYELHITGRGPFEEQVVSAAEADARIHYHGFVERGQYIKLLKSATVLVNPRPSSASRYNFPSKLLEYLVSGRPVISTRAGGVGREYGELMFVLDEETPQSLADLIEFVCHQSPQELEDIGERARAYVLTYKTWEAQGRRANDFLCDLVTGYRGVLPECNGEAR